MRMMRRMLLGLVSFLLSSSAYVSLKMTMSVPSKRVLIVGGSRFTGLYLWKELHQRGHQVTLFNRGKTEIRQIPSETIEEFVDRKSKTKYIIGDRKDTKGMIEKLAKESFDVVFDIGGRALFETSPLVDIFNGRVEQFIYMSSSGVYKKSNLMPHMEGDAEEDLSSSTSRHLGKLETEAYLKAIGVPFTCFRPTYIYGTYNYIPLEEYFFARLEAGRTVFIPGHGQHIKGLGHVQDLACAMAQAVGRDVTKGKIYNIQGKQSVTFESLATLCCEAMNKDPQRALRIGYYDKSKFDFGGEYYDKSKFDFDRKMKMSFPLANAEQHRFCSIDAAISDLEWYPKVDMLSGLKDSYENDFKAKLAAGWFSGDDYFGTDDLIATQLQKKQESIRGRYCLAA